MCYFIAFRQESKKGPETALFKYKKTKPRREFKMPRTKNTDKFFIYDPKKSGFYKNKRLLGVNFSYKGDKNNINLQDLFDFLKEQGVDLATIKLGPGSMFISELK